MKHYQTNDIKNLVLVGSSKSGKTTLAECMMYEGGVISRMGVVDDGNTVSDFNEIEQDRKNSIFSSVLHTEWRGTKLNILDTPGSDDFIGEVISSLRVADTALVVVHAQYGVEVGTEIVWRYLKKYNKPSVFVINHLDNAKSDYDNTLEQIHQQFGSGAVVMQYPYNEGEGFNAIIDLLKMVMYKFPESGGKPEKLPIPDEERARADELHNVLVEAAAEHDETLMELYFEKGELDEDELRKGLRIGMLARDLFPVFCVSARRDMGSGRLMGFLGNVAPVAGEIRPEVTTDGKEIAITDPETTLFVFKSINEKHTGAMSIFKVCSGEVTSGMELINTSSRSKGKMNQLYIVDGKNRTAVDKLSAGDIGATVKFKDTHTNHTLRSHDDGVEVKPIDFPSPRIRTAISPLQQSDDEKMGQAIHRLQEGDPTLLFHYSKELRQSILEGQGEMHLQMVKRMLSSIFGVEVEFHQPRISYRETIRSASDGYYKHKKQSGGSGQYAEVYMRIEPYQDGMPDPDDIKIRGSEVHELPWGGKLVFCNCIVGGVIDARFMPAILKGILEVMESGPVTGSYARDIRVLVYDGKMHAVDSNEISFKIAGQQAFKQAFLEASPMLLEPIYHVEVLAPDEYTGEIMTDLQGRRAIVEGITTEGTYQKVIARVPLAELNRYTTTLSAISQGRANYLQEFLEYAQVPGDIQAKLMSERVAEMA